MMSSRANLRTVSSEKMARLTGWTNRKPVVAIMGEFSAGKSTLLNMLIGESVLPTQVTATKLPPVWLRYGTDDPYRVDKNNARHPVDLNNLTAVPLKDTRYIRIYMTAEVLESCDLLDTPGISDPNFPMSNWIRAIGYANAVLWCTHAGQAWRESERSAWESLPARLRTHSLLLVTRADKIVSDIDRMKIDTRLRRETESLFGDRVFISLINALRALEGEGDPDLWSASGAESFVELLANSIAAINDDRAALMRRYKLDPSVAPRVLPRRVRGPMSDTHTERPAPGEAPTDMPDSVGADIVPLRTIRIVATNDEPEVHAAPVDEVPEAAPPSESAVADISASEPVSDDAGDEIDLAAAYDAARTQVEVPVSDADDTPKLVEDLVYEPLKFHELTDVPELGVGIVQHDAPEAEPVAAQVDEGHAFARADATVAEPQPLEAPKAEPSPEPFVLETTAAQLPAEPRPGLTATELWQQSLAEHPVVSVEDLVNAMTGFIAKIDATGFSFTNAATAPAGAGKDDNDSVSSGRRRRFRE
jgi:Dynamin family